MRAICSSDSDPGMRRSEEVAQPRLLPAPPSSSPALKCQGATYKTRKTRP